MIETVNDNNEEQGEPMERYPETLTFIRHSESKYNNLKKIANDWEESKQFRRAFNKSYYAGGKPRSDLSVDVLRGIWPSNELRELALVYFERINELMQGVSDFDTPITEYGHTQGVQTGESIADVIPKPDMIYVSPYLRTNQTLDAVLSTAPTDWSNVTRWPNESIREQEHGMNTVFNDWRLAYVFDPMEMLQSMKQGTYSYRYRGGESRFDVRDRTSRFIGRVRRKHEGEHVLAVTHHLTILAAIGELKHWTREDFMEWDENRKPENCSITIFRRQKKASRTGRDLLKLDPTDYNVTLYK